jgi:hypothetical protein
VKSYSLQFMIALMLLAGVACKQADSTKSPTARNTSKDSKTHVQRNEIFRQAEGMSKQLDRISNNVTIESERDFVNALSFCDCVSLAGRTILENKAKMGGALLEPFVPSIRMELRQNDKLKIALALPPQWSSVLIKAFGSDDEIMSQIRLTLSEKVKIGVGSNQLLSKLKFRFSPFPEWFTQDKSEEKTKGTFTMASQAARWNFVLGYSPLWKEGTEERAEDRQLQALHLMLLLSEWEYLFGLASNGAEGHFGGLTRSLQANESGFLKKYDARAGGEGGRFLSGRYSVTYDDTNSLDRALGGAEKWLSDTAEIDLEEQALIWTAGAQAFSKLRPKNRKHLSSFFTGQTPPMPDDVHKLGLSFLPGMETLLKEAFIDQSSRSIFAQSAILKPVPLKERKLAEVTTLGKLLRALTLWATELSDLSDAGFSGGTAKKLSTAPDALKKAAQLVSQNLLMSHIRAVGSGDQAPLEIVTDLTKGKVVSSSEAAELIVTLSWAERHLLQSPFLRGQLDRMFLWYADLYLAKLWKAEGSGARREDFIWALSLLKEMQESKVEDRGMIWVSSATQALENAVKSLGISSK